MADTPQAQNNALQQLNDFFYWQNIVLLNANQNGYQWVVENNQSRFINRRTKQSLTLEEGVQQGILPQMALNQVAVPSGISPNDPIARQVSMQQRQIARQAMQQEANAVAKVHYMKTIFNKTMPEYTYSNDASYLENAAGDRIKWEQAVNRGIIGKELENFPNVIASLPCYKNQETLSKSMIDSFAGQGVKTAVHYYLDTCDYTKEMATIGKTLEKFDHSFMSRHSKNGTYCVTSDDITNASVSDEMKNQLKDRLDKVVKPKITLSKIEVKDINDRARPLNDIERTRPMPRPHETIVVHQYSEADVAHAQARLAGFVKRKLITQKQVDTMVKNMQQLEKEGKLPIGATKEGKPCSNSEIYAYKMLQARELYHPKEIVYQIENGKRTKKSLGSAQEIMKGDFRQSVHALGNGELNENDKNAVVENIKGVENAVSSKGYAIAGVRVNHRYSYNTKKLPGYEEKTITIERDESKKPALPEQSQQQSGEKPAVREEYEGKNITLERDESKKPALPDLGRNQQPEKPAVREEKALSPEQGKQTQQTPPTSVLAQNAQSVPEESLPAERPQRAENA